MKIPAALAISYCVFYLLACQQSNLPDEESILASAFGEHLYLEDISEELKELQYSSDSQFVISKSVDNWLMDKILYNEAKTKVKKNTDIQALIKDYEHSLIIHAYEKQFLEEELNKEITQEEIDTFYNKYQRDFIIKDDLFQMLYLKVPLAIDNDSLRILWKTEDLPGLKNYLALNKDVLYHLDPDMWKEKKELKSIFSNSLYKKINFDKQESYSSKGDEYKFYVKILAKQKAGTGAPVNSVESIIRQRILRERSSKLLNEKKQQLFRRDIENKRISIKN